MVDSQADRELATIRTNEVPSTFGMQNDPQVANRPSEAAG